MAFVLAAMGEQLDAVLDVTVVYPQAKIPGFWQLISGQVPKVIVDIQTRELIRHCGRGITKTTRCSR